MICQTWSQARRRSSVNVATRLVLSWTCPCLQEAISAPIVPKHLCQHLTTLTSDLHYVTYSTCISAARQRVVTFSTKVSGSCSQIVYLMVKSVCGTRYSCQTRGIVLTSLPATRTLVQQIRWVSTTLHGQSQLHLKMDPEALLQSSLARLCQWVSRDLMFKMTVCHLRAPRRDRSLCREIVARTMFDDSEMKIPSHSSVIVAGKVATWAKLGTRVS
jgi:hypothetical protein